MASKTKYDYFPLLKTCRITKRKFCITVFLQSAVTVAVLYFAINYSKRVVLPSIPLGRLALTTQFNLLFERPSATLYQGFDFSLAGKQLRVFNAAQKVASNTSGVYREYGSNQNYNSLVLAEHLDQILFPWISPTFSSSLVLQESYAGDGIVICVCDKYINEAMSLLRVIRKVHRSMLPVEVFFIGEKDLSLSNRLLLMDQPLVVMRDINLIFDPATVQISGFGIKPFALLASTFQNAILIDADVVLFQPPEVLLAERGFLEDGAMFFYDRTIREGDIQSAQHFVLDLIPSPNHSKVLQMDLFKGLTFHTQESGIVVLDKRRKFTGLMATCFLNVGQVQREAFKHMYGDKETFWVGFETVEEGYYFNPHMPGTIGATTDITDTLCSVQLAHFDSKARLLWLNGGLYRNKYVGDSTMVTMNQYVVGPGSWTVDDKFMFCFKGQGVEMSAEEQHVSSRALTLFNTTL